MTADITLRGPGDVLAVLPYQLGYHPSSCVVAVSLRDRRVGLVARTDLPPPEHAGTVVDGLVGPLLRDGATSVIVIGYEDEPDASQPSLIALVERLERAGVDVLDVVVVRDGRRYSPTCSEPCCPPDGVTLPDPADVPAVAEFVARGRYPLASRDAVESLVEADPTRVRGVADAVRVRSRMPRRRRRAAVAWRLVLRPERHPRRPDVREGPSWRAQAVADAAVGLADIAWRDGLVAWLAPGVLPLAAVDRDVVALMRTTLPTWAGMGGPALDRAADRTNLDGSDDGTTDPASLAESTGHRNSADAAAATADRANLADPTEPADRPSRAHPTAQPGPARGADQTARGDGAHGPEVTDPATADRHVTGGDVAPRAAVGRRAEPPDGGERRALLERLLLLCRTLPDECPAEASAVCTVAAHVAWVEGDGALARAGIDRALRLVPDYRLALLLERLVDAGLRLPRRRDPGDDGPLLSRAV